MSLKPFFLVTYSPPLSSCLLCKNPWIFSFFLSTFSVTFFPCLQGDPLPSNAWTVALLSQDMSGIKLSGTFICVTFICLGRSRGCLWQCSCSDSNAKRTALPLLKLCLFYSFDETARIGGEYWRSLKKNHTVVFLASLPNKIWSYWHYIIDRMLECHTNVKSIGINDSSINWVGIWAQLGNVPYFIGVLGAAEGVVCWKVPGLGYLLLAMLMWVPALLCVWSLHCWRGSLGMLGTSPGRRQALCIYQVFFSCSPLARGGLYTGNTRCLLIRHTTSAREGVFRELQLDSEK